MTSSFTDLISERGFDRYQEDLEARCRRFGLKYELSYCEPTDNPAMCLDFESASQVGRITTNSSCSCTMLPQALSDRPTRALQRLRAAAERVIVGRTRVRIHLLHLLMLIGAAQGCQSRTLFGTPDGSPGNDASLEHDVSVDADPLAACSSSAECTLVNWGCCEDPCADGLVFTRAVNVGSAEAVYRITGCGKVCSVKMDCGLMLSTSCEEGRCVVHCAGQCP